MPRAEDRLISLIELAAAKVDEQQPPTSVGAESDTTESQPSFAQKNSMPVALASPLAHTAEQTAQTIAALDRNALLFVGSVPPDGRISVAQAADLLNASRLRVYELMSSGALRYEQTAAGRSLHICDVVALRERPR